MHHYLLERSTFFSDVQIIHPKSENIFLNVNGGKAKLVIFYFIFIFSTIDLNNNISAKHTESDERKVTKTEIQEVDLFAPIEHSDMER